MTSLRLRILNGPRDTQPYPAMLVMYKWDATLNDYIKSHCVLEYQEGCTHDQPWLPVDFVALDVDGNPVVL